ncbi:TAXI family TRAP transporter solute-binding subunit [Bordetella pertussis]|uniref:Exported protein n=4 Tax=Bordetella pertussis TaxID=520 RepID=Q7VSK8_BORPE|nr:TAXI family TRAP transporter solute-binding subunit [Bordetella pertussis]ETH43638.1 TRAP transporter solute receptor, TAXI family [Bordetella pertussis H939]ETH85776.1 TRAP transporter solute receptor, TAXI family [Bordetella pertussis STO1-CHOC-0018]ETH99580.1 TRAP transporter solute receptor, TAXI family [Bordetella pertussis STO1-CHOM-0012]KCV19188.1 TRAP transporter solute receptor, TAXI family [Bordetella pertussis B200]AEE65893.1 hypothetical protein BPTD_0418 [Bordetella pertussis C
MTMFIRWLILSACLLLAACSRAPDTEILQRDVGQTLAATYGPDLFDIVALRRMGSATDSTAPPGQTRRVVYYDVVLGLKKDLTLGAWDQPGAAALVSLLGAGPRSISGVKSSGNAAGDQIVAHASAIYQRDAEQWVHVAPASFTATEAPSLDTGAPPPVTRQLLQTLEQITRSVPYSASSTAQHVVQQELERSVARINGRLARLQKGYPLATGPDKGEYLAFGQALAAIGRNEQVRVIPLITGGSADNMAMLRSGAAVAALSQADIAQLAYEGKGPFESQGPFSGLRALGSLYPELVHIVVRQGDGIATVGALRGKKIALGPSGSAVRTTLETVLAAHGLQPGRDYAVIDTPAAAALPQLSEGRVDAVAQVIGTPAAPLRAALTQARLALLPLDRAAIDKLVQADPTLMALDIPANTYPSQAAAIPTVGMAALLVTTADLTRDEAAHMVDVVYRAGQDLLAAGSAQGAQVSAANAGRGLSIPLHDGAVEAFEKLGAPPLPEGR